MCLLRLRQVCVRPAFVVSRNVKRIHHGGHWYRKFSRVCLRIPLTVNTLKELEGNFDSIIYCGKVIYVTLGCGVLSTVKCMYQQITPNIQEGKTTRNW